MKDYCKCKIAPEDIISLNEEGEHEGCGLRVKCLVGDFKFQSNKRGEIIGHINENLIIKQG